MSINPVSDIVLDVANAADPAQSLAASERLARLRPLDQATDCCFSAALGAAKAAGGASADAQAGLLSQISVMGVKSGRTHAAVDGRTKAYKGLEQLVLQRMVEAMLPKDAGELFGHGTAGDIWRSMLAEQLAAQISKFVDFGLIKGQPATPGAMAGAARAGDGLRSIRSDAFTYGRQS